MVERLGGPVGITEEGDEVCDIFLFDKGWIIRNTFVEYNFWVSELLRFFVIPLL